MKPLDWNKFVWFLATVIALGFDVLGLTFVFRFIDYLNMTGTQAHVIQGKALYCLGTLGAGMTLHLLAAILLNLVKWRGEQSATAREKRWR